ncbi:ribosomal protein S18 acetylase RimI-like enzyme [Conyzicola lurida]|uniref:Ribosomal protein S18 acetylase RimI-like enzyme n=1 Tax=Conyzicola lurida TaxID=1172621 RepID=A0A841AU47_9MICO|nr:GNAT family acetyltransferase [Conyzicola lurida]MBB5845105.1 ribosomal protein S18 acetylase RimI-like enzyme [Conyzicola lurida]
MHLRPFEPRDEDSVIALWTECGITRPWNDPARDIARKLTVQPELFLVGEADGELVAAGMFGFDGTRGWIHYLAVAPSRQGESLGRAVVTEGERLLTAMGCPKINLQVRSGNERVIGFYRALGYLPDNTVSLGKRLIEDAAPE